MHAKLANINHRAVPFYAALLSTCAGTIILFVPIYREAEHMIVCVQVV